MFLSLVSQNSTRPPLKLSNVERITNFQILVLFGCLLAISLVCSIGQTIWKYQYGNDAWYMDLNCKSPSGDRWAPYSTYFVSLVHISLLLLSFYVTSLVKLLVCVVLSLFLRLHYNFNFPFFFWLRCLSKTMSCTTSEICGNVGISQFPVNYDETAVTCI